MKDLSRENTRILVQADEGVDGVIDGFLRHYGYRQVKLINLCSTAAIDEIFLELARNEYDLIILTNTSLRPCDLVRVVPEIKKKHPDLLIVVCSGWVGLEFIAPLLANKVNGVFSMPLSPVELIGSLDEILRERNMIFRIDLRQMRENGI
jgi:DNA-binding NarL/FixJ family response regulator